jgi:hypothetical protein
LAAVVARQLRDKVGHVIGLFGPLGQIGPERALEAASVEADEDEARLRSEAEQVGHDGDQVAGAVDLDRRGLL